jgi:inositol phosphorylceramide mannosyltransferase catalytic subunit
MPISKITHQIWLQGWDKRPPKFEENITSLHTLNPDWIHMNWDEAKILDELKKLGPEYTARYNAFEKIIQKVDFARYAILHNYGGVSIDLDMKALKPLDETPHVHDADFIISESPMPLVLKYNNAIIFCSPQHRYMKLILEAILNNKKKCADYLDNDVLCTQMLTGPKFISDLLGDKKDIIALDYHLFEPCVSEVRDITECKVDKNAIMDHRHEGSWIPVWMKTLLRVFFHTIMLWLLVPAAFIAWWWWPRRGGRGGKN